MRILSNFTRDAMTSNLPLNAQPDDTHDPKETDAAADTVSLASRTRSSSPHSQAISVRGFARSIATAWPASSTPLEAKDIPADGLSMRAKVGVGLGVGIGVILVIGLVLWIIYDPLARLRHSRNAEHIEAASRAQGRARSPVRNVPPTPRSLRRIVLASPIASILSPTVTDYSREMSPISATQADLRSTEPQDMTKLRYHEDAAPAPVVGRLGDRRGSSAHSRHGVSSSFSNRRPNNQSGAQGQAPQVRSGSQQSLYAIGSQGRRPSTARSRPAIGLWGIDPTVGGVTSDSTGRNASSDSTTAADKPDGASATATHDPARQEDRNDSHGGTSATQHQRSTSHTQPDTNKPLPPTPPSQTVVEAQDSQTTAGAATLRRSSSQRSAMIMMSPISLAGQQYGMAVEL